MVGDPVPASDQTHPSVGDSVEHERAEERLREAYETLRALLNGNPESLFLIDTRGIILEANQAVAARLGLTVDALVGACIYDLIPPEVAEERRKRIAEALRTGKSVRFTDKRLGRYMDNQITPVLDAEGRVTRLAILGVDVTERRGAERRLAEVSELNQKIVDTSPVGIAAFEATGENALTNEAMARIVGGTVEQLRLATAWL